MEKEKKAGQCVKSPAMHLQAWAIIYLLILLPALAQPVYAYQPFIEKDASIKPANSVEEVYNQAAPIPDPTVSSQAVYGRLSSPTEIDLYTFTAATENTIPVEALVPVGPSNQSFRPAVLFISPDIISPPNTDLPLPLPAGYGAKIIAPPQGARPIFYEEFSMERLYHGTEERLKVSAEKQYFIALYEPGHQIGSYSLRLGAAENFTNASYPSLFKNILALKLGLAGRKLIPWMDILGLLLSLLGFVCGLGAIFVLALMKPTLTRDFGQTARTVNAAAQGLVWLGLVLAIGGGAVLYRASKFSGVALFQAVIAVILILNLIYYGWRVAPRLNLIGGSQAPSSVAHSLRRKASLSLLLSILGWTSGLFLLCWYLFILR